MTLTFFARARPRTSTRPTEGSGQLDERPLGAATRRGTQRALRQALRSQVRRSGRRLRRCTWRRALATLGLGLLLLETVPVLARGVGRVLNDEELDSVFAQGLVVVNVAMSVKRVAERFDFNFTAETKIRTSDVTGDREPAQAKVDFLGGLVSVSAEPNQGSRPSGTPAPASTATATRTFDADNGALSVLVQSSGGEPAPSSNPATSAVSSPSAAQAPAPRPGVTVTFGGGDASRGGSVFAAAAKNASVDSQVNLVIRPSSNAGAMARATFMRQIRSALGGGP